MGGRTMTALLAAAALAFFVCCVPMAIHAPPNAGGSAVTAADAARPCDGGSAAPGACAAACLRLPDPPGGVAAAAAKNLGTSVGDVRRLAVSSAGAFTAGLGTIAAASVAIAMMTALYCSSRLNSLKAEREKRDLQIAAEQSGKFIMRYDLKRNRVQRIHDPLHLLGVPEAGDGSAAGVEADPESREHMRALFEMMKAAEPRGETHARLLSGDGRVAWYRVAYTLAYDRSGRPNHTIISFSDDTERHEREIAYEKWLETVNALLKDVAIYIEVNLTKDLIEREDGISDYRIIDQIASPTLSAYASYEADNVVFQGETEAYREFFRRERLLALYYGGTFEDSFEFRTHEGGENARWFRANVRMSKYPASEEVKAFVTFTDISSQRRERDKLVSMATIDGLTRLYNREATKTRIEEAIRVAAPGDVCAMFMIDLDNFKLVNDTSGHPQGDRTIFDAAAAISNVFRNSDIVGRIGGDEFMAFICGKVTHRIVEERAASVCRAAQFSLGSIRCGKVTHRIVEERAASVCRAAQFSLGSIRVSATVGVAMGRCEGSSFEALYRVSDAALYETKKRFKGSYLIKSMDASLEQPAAEARGTENKSLHFVQLQSLLEYMGRVK